MVAGVGRWEMVAGEMLLPFCVSVCTILFFFLFTCAGVTLKLNETEKKQCLIIIHVLQMRKLKF